MVLRIFLALVLLVLGACGGGFGRNTGGGGSWDVDSLSLDTGDLDALAADTLHPDTPTPDLLPTELPPGDGGADGAADGSPDAPFDAGFDAPLEILDAGLDAALQADFVDVGVDACVPDCVAKVCGADGCGGSCGECKKGKFCNSGFQCETCVPDCEDRECGEDGCGGSCGDCPGGWGCDALGLCVAPPCVGSTVTWTEAFGDVLPTGWVQADAQPEDDVAFMVSNLRAFSGDWSLHLGKPDSSSYDTGKRVTLTLESAPLEVPALEGQVALLFRLWMDCEPQTSPLYPYEHDVLFIHAVPTAGGSPVLLFDSRVTLGTTQGLWLPFGADLSALKGQSIRLRLDFDTVDEIENGYEGLYLDDLALGLFCPPCLEDSGCVGAGPCPTCVPLFKAGGAGLCQSPEEADCGL